jgi:hypothetical protein
VSPLGVRVSEVRKPVASFLTSVCAIVGGVFTLVGLLDSVLHASWDKVRRARAKAGVGKQM